MAQKKLVFVVGLWRSGTSLLHAMLNLHPQIALTFESEPFLLWPSPSPERKLPVDWPQRLEFFNQVLSRHHLAAGRLPGNTGGREASLAMFEQYAGAKGADVMGGKAPAYHVMLPKIRRIFPEARFVIIWRNPEACCRSAALAGRSDLFFAQKGIKTRIFFGAEALARGVERLRAEGGCVHEVVYDELVDNPEAELRSVCQFLEIPFDARMLALETADLSVLPEGPHHQGVRSGVICPAPSKAAPETKVEILPPGFRAKCRRYAVVWRVRYQHLRFARALPADPGVSGPGLWERGLDKIRYYFWRQKDDVKFMIIRNIPLAWWRQFRRMPPAARPADYKEKPGVISSSP